ncbi:M24 family metallopeptidase [Nocardioides zeae]|uniref:Xaa-Pro dipeptidase n=1 Tax=Nocardioides zeae TaxID=1457234 RepID=A0AAJ1X3H5_9ACTN|nr:M24 family metallopeptidase [Nocardioides zeae]MDQ1105714.1 Xaa-Pro dipeptidase [Nocardioides zeae]
MHDLTTAEFERRMSLVRAAMADLDCDLWIVTRPENIYYLSGYRAAHVAARTSRFHGILVPREGHPVLVARSLEAVTADDQRIDAVLLFDDDVDPYPRMRDTLFDGSTPRTLRVGVEQRFLSVRQWRELGAVFDIADAVDITGRVEGFASSPSADERGAIDGAARVTMAGLEAASRALAPGRRAHDVVGAAHEAMYAAGQTDFDKALVAVWTGPRGGAMHDTRVTQELVEGHVATIEIMGVDHHLRTGAQACFYLGEEPRPELTDAYALVLAMHDAARDTIAAGRTAGEVFGEADRVYQQARGIPYHRRVGGSMGLTNFAVDLTRGNPAVLQEGQPILVQTLVDDPALITHATTVVVTADGCVELTSTPRTFAAPQWSRRR